MKTPGRPATVTVRRIVVAADASAPGRVALDAAIRLAQRLQAELEGLYLEDINLKRFSELPVAREFPFGGPARDATRVADDLRNEAMSLRRAFEEATGRARIQATFRVAEGRIEHAILAEGGDADLLVMGFQRRAGFSSPRFTPTPAAVASRPLVLYDGSTSADRTLELAARLADDDAGALTVVIRAETDTEALKLRRRAAQLLAAQDHGARFRSVVRPSLIDLCRAVTDSGSSALVIASDDALLAAGGFRRLLDDVTCPVLVVR